MFSRFFVTGDGVPRANGLEKKSSNVLPLIICVYNYNNQPINAYKSY